GHDARAVEGGDAGAGPRHRLEGRAHGARRFRQGQEFQGRFGDDAEHAFRAADEAGQIEADDDLTRAPARLYDLAGGRDDFEAQHVVLRHAVLRGAYAARVLRDVAADVGVFVRRRVGRIEQPNGFDRLLQRVGRHARLGDGVEVIHVVLSDPVHAIRADDDAAVHGHSAAAVTHAAAARRDWK